MNKPHSQPSASHPVAVIDVGSTSVRMTIAQRGDDGGLRTLEFLHQAVALGKDTFTQGVLSKETIEECVDALRRFRNVLQEYHIEGPPHLRAVATTAVREASNRDSFVDRVSIATGMTLESIDTMEVSRLTFLSFQALRPLLPKQARGRTLITEAGGGSTSLLLLDKGAVRLSQVLGLGTLRVHELMAAAHAASTSEKTFIANHIERTIHRIIPRETLHSIDWCIALGGDIRFAANQLFPLDDEKGIKHIGIKALNALTDSLMPLSIDELMLTYHLSQSDAETLRAALLSYIYLARACNLDSLAVTPVSMRHGILLELAGDTGGHPKLRRQVIQSCRTIGKKYQYNEKHARHVAYLALLLFDVLQEEHRLDPSRKLVLECAALLHDIGSYVNTSGHHKHSLYLIQNSEIFGLSAHDKKLVAFIARYHRRALPKPSHLEFTRLSRSDRLLVSKTSAILRVADALDRSDTQRITRVTCVRRKEAFVLSVHGIPDLSLEQLALQNKGTLFEDVYGMNILLRRGKGG